MSNLGRNIGYFMSWGGFYGIVLGTWSTTLMAPTFGTLFGLPWATGIGAACGLLCGLLVSLIYPTTLDPDTDLVRSSRRLSLGIGALVGIAAPALLILTTHGILWGPYSGELNRFFAPSVLAALVWGSLSAAYVAYSYPFVLAHSLLGQKDSFPSQWIFVPFFMALVKKSASWITVAVGAVLGAVWSMTRYMAKHRRVDPWDAGRTLSEGIEGVAGGIIAVVVLTVMMSLAIASLVTFLGRILFSEGSLSHTGRLFLTASAALFTGVVLCWFVVDSYGSHVLWSMPIGGAILAGFYVYQALPLVTAQDKAKRKEKNALALAEEADSVNDLFIEEEALIEAHQH